MATQETASERQLVEQYLKQYALEECLDEVINEVVEKRPTNPFMTIAKSMEAKTMPEILTVDLTPIIVGQGVSGVQAIVLTNIAPFYGTAAYGSDVPAGTDVLRDFTVIREKVREAFVNVDPRDTSGVDKILTSISGMDTPIALALSIACCRAGARHRGLPLYRFLAESAGSTEKMKMPLPVASVLARATGTSDLQYQCITVTPSSSTSLEGAIEAELKAGLAIGRKLNEAKPPMMTSVQGCPRAIFPTLLDAVKFVTSALVEGEVEGGLKPGVHMLGTDLSVSDENADKYDYNIDGATKSATDQVDLLLNLWKEVELVTIEDPVNFGDLESLRAIKSRVTQAIVDVRRDPASTMLQYCKGGIGGDDGCTLQVVADSGCSDASFITSYESETVYNTVRVSLHKVGGSVHKAMLLCEAARRANMAVIIGCELSMPETDDSFLADFAVAMGASQLMAGGMWSSEHSAKVNRLMEIGREDESILFSFLGRRFRK